MTLRVSLAEIIDGMESQSYVMTSYLNKKTGKVVTITEEEMGAAEEDEPIEEFPEWEHEGIETAKEILEGDDYIPLPSQFDIDEYAIMERFCLSIEDDELRELMYGAIKGRGAFRRFKNNIHRYNIAEDWYAYRYEALREIAVAWCGENNIEYRT